MKTKTKLKYSNEKEDDDKKKKQKKNSMRCSFLFLILFFFCKFILLNSIRMYIFAALNRQNIVNRKHNRTKSMIYYFKPNGINSIDRRYFKRNSHVLVLLNELLIRDSNSNSIGYICIHFSTEYGRNHNQHRKKIIP